MDTADKSPIRKKHWVILVLILLGFISLLIFYYRHAFLESTAERELRKVLESKGLELKHITLAQMDMSHATLTDVELGSEHSLTIQRIDATYRWEDIIHGKIQTLALEGVEAEVYKEKNGWRMGGLEPLQTAPSQPSSGPMMFDMGQLRQMVPGRVTLTQSQLTVKGPGLEMSLPLEGELNATEELRLQLTSKGGSTKVKQYGLQVGQLAFNATLGADGKWQGTLAGTQLAPEGLALAMPPLGLDCTFQADPHEVQGDFKIHDDKALRKVDGTLTLPLEGKKPSVARLKEVTFPWSDGTISVNSVQIQLDAQSPVSFVVNFRNLELGSFIDDISNERVKAAGKVSGSIPITYLPGGKILLGQGSATGDGPGHIQVAPELIPGAGHQELETVRKALENFDYQSLDIQIMSGSDGTAGISLKLSGHNPEAFEGREVKLNINFTGDILPLIEQSVLPFNDLGQLLRNEE